MSQKDEDVTTERLVHDIIERIKNVEEHLLSYQEKVRNALKSV